MRTITRLFDYRDDAADAVRELERRGIDDDNISLVSNNTDEGRRADRRDDVDEEDDNEAAEGAATGAGVGGVLGGGAGLLAGLGMLAIPGIGPVVAAGWLASTAVGAAVGAVAGAGVGGIVGALTDAGESEEDAHVYAEGVRRGGTLVSVRCEDDEADEVTSILRSHGGVEATERGRSYRDEGWSRFDADAPAYDRDQIARERTRYADTYRDRDRYDRRDDRLQPR